MPYDAVWAVAALVAVLGLLAFSRTGPDLILVTALTTLVAVGAIGPHDALSGLGNEGMVTVAVLYIVAAGLEDSGALSLWVPRLLGRPRSVVVAQLRMSWPVVAMSAFLNNTPIVAMFIPAVTEWARKNRLSLSKLMIPLSYASILGGMCTLIGTSTNLVVNGLLIDHARAAGLAKWRDGLGMFEISALGIPCAVVGLGYLLLVGRKLLPDRVSPIGHVSDPRQYTVEMVVGPGSPVAGKTIEEAGLRQLHGMYLMEIERDGELMVAVGPEQVLHGGDRLVFVGIVDSVVDLQRMPGLTPATDQVFKLNAPRSHRCLVEAVVSDTCGLVGKTVREGGFRTLYGAVIVAVARNGERLRKKIGDIVLRPGDTLLLEALPSFVRQHYHSRDFFLVSKVEDVAAPRFERAPVSIAILVAMVAAATAGWFSMLESALIAAVLMVLSRCCTWTSAKRSIDWRVILVIVAAFGLGRALDVTGAAGVIAGALVSVAGSSPWLTLVAVYAVTSLFTEVITNNAAAVLVFPIAMASAARLGINPQPFVMSIMVAASASFATPIGYQTNLMVYGPGGYRFSDYLRVGVPLNLLLLVVTVLLAPLLWPF